MPYTDKDKNQDLSLQDLRVIIHGLKMAGFANIEPEALDQIKFRIKSLPSAEELNDLGEDLGSMKRIAKEIGELMRLLEIYGKKNTEFKARFESLKGLPPRYKVLDFKKQLLDKAASMNNTKFVRQVIGISCIADSKGHAIVAKQLNDLAKHALENKEIKEEAIKVASELSKIKMDKESDLIKEALSWNPKTWFPGARRDEQKGQEAYQSQQKKEQKSGRELAQARATALRAPEQAVKQIAKQIDGALQSLAQFDTHFEYSGMGILKQALTTSKAEVADLSELLSQAFEAVQQGKLANAKVGDVIAQLAPKTEGEKGSQIAVGEEKSAPTAANAAPSPAPSVAPATPAAAAPSPAAAEQPPINFEASFTDPVNINEMIGILQASSKTRIIKMAATISPEVRAYLEKVKSNPEMKAKILQQLNTALGKATPAPATPAPAPAPAPAASVTDWLSENTAPVFRTTPAEEPSEEPAKEDDFSWMQWMSPNNFNQQLSSLTLEELDKARSHYEELTPDKKTMFAKKYMQKQKESQPKIASVSTPVRMIRIV